MPAARHPKRPRLTSAPRRALSSSLHPYVDSALKTARQCTQQLAPLEACLDDELRVLERLYYKGVNQHRMALFWRRVEEARRLGRRVQEARILSMTEDLRYAFYLGEDSERNPKILKGAWSQVPDGKFLNFIYERTNSLLELLGVAKERLAKAYHSLSLMMQTGAFLQTILILTAIVSRLSAVMSELEPTLCSLSNALRTLLEALGHKKPSRRKHESVQRLPTKRPRLEIREDIVMDDIGGEDLGSTVVRRDTIEAAGFSNAGVEKPSFTDTMSSFWQQSTGEDPPLPETPSLIISTVPTNRPEKITPSEPKKVKEKKKKKKRKDVIDDIFGSL